MTPDDVQIPLFAEDDSTGWLVTFSDIVLQLFAFLLVLGVAQRSIDPSPPSSRDHLVPAASAALPEDDAPLAAADGIQGVTPVRTASAEPAGGPARSLVLPPENPPAAVLPPQPAVTHPQATAVESPEDRLRRIVRERGLTGAVVVSSTVDGLVVSLGEAAGYPPGSVEAPPTLTPLLAEVRRVITAWPASRLEIDGHADSRPIRTQRFPSNLELSVARASAVARAIIGSDEDLRRRTSVSGHAEGRPVATNDDDLGRARNRRVEVRVLLSPAA